MSVWVRSFYLDFEKLSPHWAIPFSLALGDALAPPSLRAYFFFFILYFSLAHVFLTQNATLKTKKQK